MIASLVLSALIAARSAQDPPGLFHGAPPRYSDIEAVTLLQLDLDRRQLEVTRRGIDRDEENIAFLESCLTKYADFMPPQLAAETRRQVEGMRKALVYWRQIEQELSPWEQQRKQSPGWVPGRGLGAKTNYDNLERLEQLHQELWPRRQTAPMPREKK